MRTMIGLAALLGLVCFSQAYSQQVPAASGHLGRLSPPPPAGVTYDGVKLWLIPEETSYPHSNGTIIQNGITTLGHSQGSHQNFPDGMTFLPRWSFRPVVARFKLDKKYNYFKAGFGILLGANCGRMPIAERVYFQVKRDGVALDWGHGNPDLGLRLWEAVKFYEFNVSGADMLEITANFLDQANEYCADGAVVVPRVSVTPFKW